MLRARPPSPVRPPWRPAAAAASSSSFSCPGSAWPPPTSPTTSPSPGQSPPEIVSRLLARSCFEAVDLQKQIDVGRDQRHHGAEQNRHLQTRPPDWGGERIRLCPLAAACMGRSLRIRSSHELEVHSTSYYLPGYHWDALSPGCPLPVSTSRCAAAWRTPALPASECPARSSGGSAPRTFRPRRPQSGRRTPPAAACAWPDCRSACRSPASS